MSGRDRSGGTACFYNNCTSQQNIELKKAALGKEGDVVDKITQDRDQSDPLEDVDDGKNKLVGVVFAGDDSHLED